MNEISVGDCTLFVLPLGWLVRLQAKQNVCNVGWQKRNSKIFVRGKKKLKHEALPVHSKLCLSVIFFVFCLFIQSCNVQGCTVANRVAHNGWAYQKGDFYHKGIQRNGNSKQQVKFQRSSEISLFGMPCYSLVVLFPPKRK